MVPPSPLRLRSCRSLAGLSTNAMSCRRVGSAMSLEVVLETTSPEQIVLVSSDDLPSGEGHHIGPPSIIRLPAHALLLRQLLP